MRSGPANRRAALWIGVGAALLLATGSLLWSARPEPPGSVLRAKVSDIPQAAPLCPWREPERDLRAFFPGADRWLAETRVLSAYHLELTQRLGRRPAPDEHTLLLYHVHHGRELAGAVMTRRAKGEYGAIEVVVAVTPAGGVRGVRLQRLREPDPIARALRAPAWLNGFAGRTARSDWQPAAMLAWLPPAARAAGQAVVEAARSLVILYDVSTRPGVHRLEPHH